MTEDTVRQWQRALSKGLAVTGVLLSLGAWAVILPWLASLSQLPLGAATTGLFAGAFLGPAFLNSVGAALLPERNWAYVVPGVASQLLAVAVPSVLYPNPQLPGAVLVAGGATAAAACIGALLVVLLMAVVQGRQSGRPWLTEWAQAVLWISLAVGGGLALLLIVGAAIFFLAG